MEGHGHDHHLQRDGSQGLEPAELPSQSPRLGPLAKDRGPSCFPQEGCGCAAWADICVGKHVSRTAAGWEQLHVFSQWRQQGGRLWWRLPAPKDPADPSAQSPGHPTPEDSRTSPRLANTSHSTREWGY